MTTGLLHSNSSGDFKWDTVYAQWWQVRVYCGQMIVIDSSGHYNYLSFECPILPHPVTCRVGYWPKTSFSPCGPIFWPKSPIKHLIKLVSKNIFNKTQTNTKYFRPDGRSHINLTQSTNYTLQEFWDSILIHY